MEGFHVTTIAKLKEPNHEVRSVVYSKSHDDYIQIKSFDEKENKYTARMMKG